MGKPCRKGVTLMTISSSDLVAAGGDFNTCHTTRRGRLTLAFCDSAHDEGCHFFLPPWKRWKRLKPVFQKIPGTKSSYRNFPKMPQNRFHRFRGRGVRPFGQVPDPSCRMPIGASGRTGDGQRCPFGQDGRWAKVPSPFGQVPTFLAGRGMGKGAPSGNFLQNG